MKRIFAILTMAALAAAASAQTAAKPATYAAATKPAATAAKLPPGIPVVKGVMKTAFSLRYQDTKIGTGAVAESGKLYQVRYTGWLAADGRKFDSSYDHPAQPVMGKDGQPVKGADGKPEMEAGQPIVFPQGYGRVIPGWDQGFEGMRIGGKRRLFIPYQLAYGARGRLTGDPKNPGIPAKADLIFDVELVDVWDLPAPASHPGMGGMNMPAGHPGMGGATMPAGHPGMGSVPTPPPPGHVVAAPATPDKPAAPATPAAPAAPAAPKTPATPQE